MNQYYGSDKIGRRRLAHLTRIEREAGPTHGRSRAERVLDIELAKLKKARTDVDSGSAPSSHISQAAHKSSFFKQEKKGVIRVTGGLPPPSVDALQYREDTFGDLRGITAAAPARDGAAGSEKRIRSPEAASAPAVLHPRMGVVRSPVMGPSNGHQERSSASKARSLTTASTEPSTPAGTLLQVLRRLDHRSKFRRSLDLLRKFFTKMPEGAKMLETWQAAITKGKADWEKEIAGGGTKRRKTQELPGRHRRYLYEDSADSCCDEEGHSLRRKRSSQSHRNEGEERSEQNEQRDSIAEAALAAEAYLVFYAAFRVATCPNATTSGDGREVVMWLFHHFFLAAGETATEAAMKFEPLTKDILPSHFDLDWMLVPTGSRSQGEPPTVTEEKSTSTAGTDFHAHVVMNYGQPPRIEKGGTPARAEGECTSLSGASASGMETGANEGDKSKSPGSSPPAAVSIPTGKEESILSKQGASAAGQTLQRSCEKTDSEADSRSDEEAAEGSSGFNSVTASTESHKAAVKRARLSSQSDEKSNKQTAVRLFFTCCRDWYIIYQTLLPVIRIAALATNYLYTDDAHIFHRGMRYLEHVFDFLPNDASKDLIGFRKSVKDDPNVSPEQFNWHLPNGLELLHLIHRLFADQALSTIHLCHRTPWAKSTVEAFFDKVYRHRREKFTPIEIDQIEYIQAQLKKAAAVTTNGPVGFGGKTITEPITPGQAHVPIRDTRVQIISTTAGAQNWAIRQIPH